MSIRPGGGTTGSGTSGTDATTTSKGVVQLAGDLGGSAASPTVPALAAKMATPSTSPTSVGQRLVTDGTNPLWLTPSTVGDTMRVPQAQTAGSGTAARASDSYTFTATGANDAACLRIPTLGFFTVSANLKVSGGSGTVMQIVPNGQATPAGTVSGAVWINDDAAGTVTVQAQESAVTTLGTVTVGTTNPYAASIQHKLGQWIVTITPSGGTTTTFTVDANLLLRTSGGFGLGPLSVVIGRARSTGGASLTMTASAVRVVRTPQDSYGNLVAPEPLSPVARALTVEKDVHLAAGLHALRTCVQLNTAGTRFFTNAGTGYPVQCTIDLFLSTLLLRDVGAITLARDNWIGQLASQTAATGLAPFAINPDGTLSTGTTNFAYFNFAQMCYFLSADGDATWFDYEALRAHIAFWEIYRKQSDGCFAAYNAQETGWDSTPALDPSMNNTTPTMTYEWIGCSAMMYREYLAMQAIATTKGYTTDAASYAAKAAALKTAIQTSLWDSTAQWFMAKKISDSTFNERYSGDNVYALFAGVATTAQALAIRNRLMDPTHMLGAFGIRSLDATDTDYHASGIQNTVVGTNWNGALWPEVSYMAAIGLWRYGYVNDALEVARRAAQVHTVNAQVYTTLSGLPGEWNHPDTGVGDAASTHLPYTGRSFGFALAEWHLAKNYDPTVIDPTTVVRPVANMSITHPEIPFSTSGLVVAPGYKSAQTATVYARDDFLRAAGTLGTTDTGQAWTNVTGSHTITGPSRVQVTFVGGGFSTMSVFDCGQNNAYYEMTLTLSPNNNRTNNSLVFAYTDTNNHIKIDTIQGGAQIYATVGGTETARGTLQGTFTPGSTHTIGCRKTATTLQMYVDGVAVGSVYTMTAGEQALTATKCGIRSYTNTGNQDDGNTKYRRILVTA